MVVCCMMACSYMLFWIVSLYMCTSDIDGSNCSIKPMINISILIVKLVRGNTLKLLFVRNVMQYSPSLMLNVVCVMLQEAPKIKNCLGLWGMVILLTSKIILTDVLCIWQCFYTLHRFCNYCTFV